MQLYFQNTSGEERLIAEPTDNEDVIREIHKFCDDRNFKISYIIHNLFEDKTVIDVGSHTEFFILYDKESDYEYKV